MPRTSHGFALLPLFILSLSLVLIGVGTQPKAHAAGGSPLLAMMVAPDAVPAAPAAAPAEPVPTVDTLAADVQKVATDYRTGGFLGAGMAIVILLVNLTRIPVVADWMDKRKAWMRPLLASGLALAGSLIAGRQLGLGWAACLLSGGVIGALSVFAHQLYSNIISPLIPKKA